MPGTGRGRAPRGRDLVGDGLAEGGDRRLGRGVGTLSRLGRPRRVGGHVHDDAPAALDHAGDDGERAGHGGEEVDVEDAAHRSEVATGHRQHQVDAGVVDEDVDRPCWSSMVSSVAPKASASPTSHTAVVLLRAPCQLGGELVEQFLAPGQPDDGGAALGQGEGDRPADARRGAGDHGDAPVESLGVRVRRKGPMRHTLVGRRSSAAASGRGCNVLLGVTFHQIDQKPQSVVSFTSQVDEIRKMSLTSLSRRRAALLEHATLSPHGS